MTRIPVSPATATRADERAAVDAIARVLDAERAARDRIRRAEADAAAREDAARAEARAIAERAERRLAAVRAAFAARTARAVAAAAEQAAELDAPHRLTAADSSLARAAAVALALELTSGADGGPESPR